MAYGELLWEPTARTWSESQLGEYIRWLHRELGLDFRSREELWVWSVDKPEEFWASIWRYYGVMNSAEPEVLLTHSTVSDAQWFLGAQLNFAQNILSGNALNSQTPGDQYAIRGFSQTRDEVSLTYKELQDEVSQVARFLRERGVRQGDRVVAYIPNIPEAVVFFLASASIGAVFASCAIEFGSRSVLDRFGQLEPRVLVTVGGYNYGSKTIDRANAVDEVIQGLPSVETVIDLEFGSYEINNTKRSQQDDLAHITYGEILARVAPEQISFAQVSFDHPLVVLFSSGTTGIPKAIVHGHGGILLEHLKNHNLSWDLKPGDVFMWYTTPSWMMWNALVSGLLCGATIVCLDGNPTYPDLEWQWRIARETQATVVGVAPGYLMACRKAGIEPRKLVGNSPRVVASAGAPLPEDGYQWIYDQFPEVFLNIGSGGTDVCSGIVQGDPLLPVWAGAISGPALGVAATAYDDEGRPLINQLGELVITVPMPSMPVCFWGDHDRSKINDAYFEYYPAVWRHGDWIEFSSEGYCRVAGRSDATLNRGGVRIGTAEYYSVTEDIPGVAQALVVHLEDQYGNGQLILFVELEPDVHPSVRLRKEIISRIRALLSPRHVPDKVVVVPKIPTNRTGKKLEVPVKKILQGHPLQESVSLDTLADPTSIDYFVRAQQHGLSEHGWEESSGARIGG